MRPTSQHRLLPLFALLLLLASVRVAEAQKPISEWEKAAVELAIAYSTQGAGAWWEALAEESPWKAAWRSASPDRRAAIRAAAIDQIRARVGPVDGTRWELQTVLDEPGGPAPAGRLAAFHLHYAAGSDSVLLLELVPATGAKGDDGPWRLASLRTWGEPAGAGADEEIQALALRETVESPAPRPDFGALPFVGAVLLVPLGFWLRRSRPRVGGALLAAVGVALLIGGAQLVRGLASPSPAPRHPAEQAAATPPPSTLSAAALAELRQDLAFGRAPSRQGEAPSPEDGPEMARLWRIQWHLQNGDLNQAEAALRELGSRPAPPLRFILRGRLAFLRGDEVSTALAYEQALAELPPLDSVLYESAEALLLAGYEEKAREQLMAIARGGGRMAAVYYLLARFAAVEGEEEAAARWLEKAWNLDPLERADLLGETVYAYIIRAGGLFDLLDLSNPREPPIAAPDLAQDPIAVPPGWAAVPHGGSLTLSRDTREIRIPGGSALSPSRAAPLDATTLREQEDERLLVRLADLQAAAALPGVIAQPALRSTLTKTAVALARHHRWAEVVTLTEALAAHPERLPGNLGRLRAEALRHTGQAQDATALLIELAKSNVHHRRRDPQALFHLADLLVEVNRYDLALRVARTAESQSPLPPSASLLPRIRMEKRLAESFAAYRSPRFVIRYPASLGPYGPQLISEVLEAEVDRLQRWIPHQPSRPIEVDLFPFKEFFQLYSPGGEVLGIFDGKVRVPLAELPALSPFVVAILTHEIAHALIADATSERAPAWFHEGLAQHVQMLQNRLNPIPDYQRAGRLIAFPLLEPVLRSHADGELTAVAYDQAAWVVHFLEARHGVAGIHRLLDAYGQPLTPAEVLATALSTNAVQLDADFRAWSASQAPTAWPTRIVRYDRGERP